MAESQFHVVFRGELTGDVPEDAAKRNLAALFRMAQEKIEPLFSGKTVVVKRGVDEATARKFERAFRQAGAVCEVRAIDAPESGGRAEDGGSRATPRERDGGRAAHAGGAGSIAAAGDPHGTILEIAVPDDLGDLAIDDSDTPMQPPRTDPPPEIDTSGLDLATDDAPLEDRPKPPAPEIDTSGLSLEPQPAETEHEPG